MTTARLALRLIAAALVVPGSAGLAFAADLPFKAPTVESTVYNWTGIYGGVHADGALASSASMLRPASSCRASNSNGWAAAFAAAATT